MQQIKGSFPKPNLPGQDDETFPLTTNISAWYFNSTIFVAVVIIGLAVYGFYTSIAGQPVFGGKTLKEIE